MKQSDIIDLAVKAGLLNYVDNETPRRYFVSGKADLEEVLDFAGLILGKCPYCDGTGDVHDMTGEWRGECNYCHTIGDKNDSDT